MSLTNLPSIVFRESQAKRFLKYLDKINFYWRIKCKQMDEFFNKPINKLSIIHSQQRFSYKLRNSLHRCLSLRQRVTDVSLERLSKEVGKLECTEPKIKSTKSKSSSVLGRGGADEITSERDEETRPSGSVSKKYTIKEIVEMTAAKQGAHAEQRVFIILNYSKYLYH